MARTANKSIVITPAGIALRVVQIVFAALVLSLSAYTLSKFTTWNHVRFTVAAVPPIQSFSNVLQAGWAIVSLTCLIILSLAYDPQALILQFLVLGLEFINFDLFLAAWISLASNIGKRQECAAPGGGHEHSTPCDTIYSALAFAILEWLLFAFTFFSVIRATLKAETARF